MDDVYEDEERKKTIYSDCRKQTSDATIAFATGMEHMDPTNKDDSKYIEALLNMSNEELRESLVHYDSVMGNKDTDNLYDWVRMGGVIDENNN